MGRQMVKQGWNPIELYQEAKLTGSEEGRGPGNSKVSSVRFGANERENPPHPDPGNVRVL